MIRRLLLALLGALTAILFLYWGQQSSGGNWIIRLPLFAVYPIYLILPATAVVFGCVYAFGLMVGHYALGYYGNCWAWPESLVMISLIAVPHLFEKLQSSNGSRFKEMIQNRGKSHDQLKFELSSMTLENDKIEKQLRDIGHLYDVMREAGSTLNVQEMLSLAREFTERMFNLPHFVMAMLSEDGKRYEIKVSSGCDDVQFRTLSVEVDPKKLAARLAKDRRTLWLSDLREHTEYTRISDLSIRSLVFIPFVVQNQVIGFFCSYSTQGEVISAEKFTNLQLFFNQISIGLQKALLYEKVQRLSITDGLTHLFSHRYFRQRLEEELVLVKRYASNLTLLILDIDHFKRYNDSYGHVAGDQVLMETAKILKETCDVTHHVARYGGEEMVVLVPEANKEQGIELAEKIRHTIEEHNFKVGKESTRVTVSIGVATYPQDASSGVDLIAQSDKALYTAKEGGRNRVVGYHLGLRTQEKKVDTSGTGG